jgi:hypothetical protein
MAGKSADESILKNARQSTVYTMAFFSPAFSRGASGETWLCHVSTAGIFVFSPECIETVGRASTAGFFTRWYRRRTSACRRASYQDLEI